MIVDYEKDPRAKEAIAIWEKGVLKEKDGSMSDAINFYRSALKIHDNVESLYRKKYLMSGCCTKNYRDYQ